jgi:hypothetical protein
MPSGRFLVTNALALMTFLAVSLGANADTVRHCTGYVGATPLSGVNANGQPFIVGQKKSLAALTLKGRGTCRNALYANECRRNARDAIRSCAQGIWAERWNKKIPISVCESADNNRPPHAGIISWGNTETSASMRAKITGDIKQALEYTACCVLQPTARQVNFSVYLAVHGDTGCGHNSLLLGQAYEANCQNLKSQGLC